MLFKCTPVGVHHALNQLEIVFKGFRFDGINQLRSRANRHAMQKPGKLTQPSIVVVDCAAHSCDFELVYVFSQTSIGRYRRRNEVPQDISHLGLTERRFARRHFDNFEQDA